MKIIDHVDVVDDGNHTPFDFDETPDVAIHRIWFDDWKDRTPDTADPDDIIRRFVMDPKITIFTKGEIPYTMLFTPDGGIHQYLPLDEAGAHARRWNSRAIGLGVVGDFRKYPPTHAQISTLTDFVAALSDALDVENVKGHDELPGGSKDKDKQCPGRYLDMDVFRSDVLAVRRHRGMVALTDFGVRWSR